MKRKLTVSVIVSTYNRPDALSLCLKSLAVQTYLPDEIVIGDDGSNEETKVLIELFQQDFPVPIIHIWQEDKGFRLAKCRNKAVAASKGEYVIEIDGDLILNKNFVEDHVRFARPGCFLRGGRVNINDRFTRLLCNSQKIREFNFFSNGLIRRSNTIHCLWLSRYLLTRYKKNQTSGLGCNMSFWRKDFIVVNGYDEFFEGWGSEDSDLASRMICSGVRRLSLKFSGIVYHLWHNDLYMESEDKNLNYYHEQKEHKKVRCKNGIDKYLTQKNEKLRQPAHYYNLVALFDR